MYQELETLVANLVVALSKKELPTYPMLEVFRHHMVLTVHPDDQLHELFEHLDFDDTELTDLLTCSGAEVVKLHDKFIGLRLNQYSSIEQDAVYWIRIKENCRGSDMSELYDSAKTFLESTPEEKRGSQRIALGECGILINWRMVQNHIVNNPRDIVLGCLNHPNRYFTPSAGLYVKMKDAKDNEVLPSFDNLSLTDVRSDEPIWFTIGKTVRNSIVL